MPTFHNCAQGEAEWLKVRVGKVTASELDNLISPGKFEIRTGEGPKNYLYRKTAEAWRGQPLPGFSSWSTDQGQELEDEARRWYFFNYEDHKSNSVGFVTGDDGRCGCSPDALLGDVGGVEIKCPEPTNHVRYLVEGKLPTDYVAQVHMSLYVTGRPWWRFVSYRRGFPAFVLTIERDEEKCAVIAKALAGFYDKMDAALAKLKEQDL